MCVYTDGKCQTRGKHAKQCAECGKDFLAKMKNVRFCSASCSALNAAKRKGLDIRSRPRICQNQKCRKEFFKAKRSGNKTKGLYCSRKCAGQLKSAVAKESAESLSIITAIADGMLAHATDWKKCKWCEKSIYKTGYGNFCDFNCYGHFRNGFWKRCEGCGDAIDRRVKLQVRLCEACSRERLSEYRRASKAKRRARMYENGRCELIKPKNIFKRDGWVCGICNKPTDRHQQVPHPRAPTLDHIIPLAKGGTHTADNVQCACFECNWRKGDGIAHNGEAQIGHGGTL